jgi:hypothetical protein
MIRGPLCALFSVWALALPAYAVGPASADDHGTADETEGVDPIAVTLPASMLRHGIAGYVPPPEGIDILDPAILVVMRDRLIMYVQDNAQ